MQWASFDTFLVQNAFWQDKMGRPVVNKDFLKALLTYGQSDAYRFYCPNQLFAEEMKKKFFAMADREAVSRVKIRLQARFVEDAPNIQTMHQGDFTFHMPHLIAARNKMNLNYSVTGVTHSLDQPMMHMRLLQLLMAGSRSCDTIICTSRCALVFLQNSFSHLRHYMKSSFGARMFDPPSLVRIPLGANETAFSVPKKLEARNLLKLPPDSFVMLSLGRFSARNKMDLSPLLEWVEWMHITGRLSNFILILSGGGKPADVDLIKSMIDHLKIGEKVRVMPNVSIETKSALFSGADVFVSLSDNYQETFGLTIIEAMAAGLPVVASDFDGYRDLVVNGKTGFLLPTAASVTPEPWESIKGIMDSSMLGFYQAQKIFIDFNALSGAVLTLAQNSDLRKAMSHAARKQAEAYRWEKIIPQYEAVWQESLLHARTTSSKQPQKDTCLSLPWKESYAHWPGMTLSPETRIRLSRYGAFRIHRSFSPIMYDETKSLLDQNVLSYLVTYLAKGVTSLADLTAKTAFNRNIPSFRVILHVDWLIKHGYIQLQQKD